LPSSVIQDFAGWQNAPGHGGGDYGDQKIVQKERTAVGSLAFTRSENIGNSALHQRRPHLVGTRRPPLRELLLDSIMAFSPQHLHLDDTGTAEDVIVVVKKGRERNGESDTPAYQFCQLRDHVEDCGRDA
jgi:hypothetical protein